MEYMTAIFDFLYFNYNHHGPGFLIPFFILGIIAVAGQWSLYDKAGLPGVACIVPIWNVTTFLKIMGRPAWQIVYFLIPVFNLYFIVKVYVELCHCFGKRSWVHYFLVIFLNGFYVLFLGLSYHDQYIGPVYGSPDGMPVPSKKKPVKKNLRRRVVQRARSIARHRPVQGGLA